MTAPGPKPATESSALDPVGERRFPVLEAIRSNGATWAKIAPKSGVTNPEPPWKVSLHATLECLSASTRLPSLERRFAEDRLGETLYQDLSQPEQQLISLAHILLSRGLLSEGDLSEKLKAVGKRLRD